MAFEGNTTSTGLEIQGQCGLKPTKCNFGTNKVGILLHNKDGDEFTEFNVAEDCDFSVNCEIPLEYKRTGSATSFHGSGLGKGCTINQRENATESVIKIGANCTPYNSPLNFTCWTRSPISIIKNEGSAQTNFYGAIGIEPFLTNEYINLSEGNTVYYNGTIQTNNQALKIGNLIQCLRIQQNSDGSLNAFKTPRSYYKQLSAGDTVLTGLANDGEDVTISIIISAPFYEYQFTLLATKHYAANTGNVTTLANQRSFNQTGYDSPTFSFSNNQIIISNSNYPANTVNCYYTVTQIGSRAQYIMQ